MQKAVPTWGIVAAAGALTRSYHGDAPRGFAILSMRKPANITYGLDEPPPLGVTILSGVQHVGVMSIYLVFPAAVASAAGAPPDVAAAMISMTLVALALGTLMQSFVTGPIGSGFLCQPIASVLYFVPSLVAVKHGGLAAVFGMTILAGLLEVGVARALGRLRAILPAEIAGLVVLLAGIATGIVGLRTAMGGAGGADPARPADLGLALLTLAVMIALNVWGRGMLRFLCVLIGIVAGCVAARALGRVVTPPADLAAAVPLFSLPRISHVEWTFDATLLLPFAVAALAATLKTIGNVTTSQKVNDADWVRADMRSITGGVVADGLGTALAGVLGAHGLTSSTSAVGLTSATGVTSRRVAWAVAAFLFVLAFVPRLGHLFHSMPRAVAGAALVFAASFIIINGLEIITSRLLDSRRTLVIGLALIVGLAIEVSPVLLELFPRGVRDVLGTSLVLGTLTALALNALFRIGVRKTATMTVQPGPVASKALGDFIELQGAVWGARRDVIERASFNLAQSIETIAGSRVANGPLAVAATFDEFTLHLRVSYAGPPLELPDTQPTMEDILESEDGERRLAGFLLRQYADRVGVSHKNGRSTVLFDFDH
jgi:xanthine permease XanP